MSLDIPTAEPMNSDVTETASRKSDGEPESQPTPRSERELLGRAVQAWPEWTEDDDNDEPETYDDYGDWQDDYADAVGIPRYGEL